MIPGNLLPSRHEAEQVPSGLPGLQGSALDAPLHATQSSGLSKIQRVFLIEWKNSNN